MWETDTLAQEEARFPGTLELITGRFPEFYRWRLADRKRRLKQDPDNQAWLEDLAVSSRYREDALPAFPWMASSGGLLLLAGFTLWVRKRSSRKRKAL